MEKLRAGFAALTFSMNLAAAAELVAPGLESPLGPGGPALARYSSRTVVAAVEIDRDQARLLAYTVKPRPYVAELENAQRSTYEPGKPAEVEVALIGPAGIRHTRRVEVSGLCLEHAAEDEPHVEGDTIRLHRESILVELPELAGFDRLELAYREESRGDPLRVSLGLVVLEAERFTPAGGSARYEELAFASASPAATSGAPTTGAVIWPEQIGDPDVYQLYGNAAESDRRINVVIVPDGYRPLDKALMETHADQLVAYFRGKTPYKEHDPFMNYTLVYAYSTESGTDQCDCGIVADTAMGTRFPAGAPCADTANRCLFYGSGCDTASTANIAAAELRAPFRDVTVVMVNTTRYGGCGGNRSVYAAGNASATEIAVHELGHTLALLADEYGGSGCGSNAGGINTSLDPVDGEWPEWVAELGAPRQGAQYHDQCVYRPLPSCDMRSLGPPFCPVCNQQWSLRTFGHARVAPTAPVTSMSPSPAVSLSAGASATFAVTTRFSTGPGVTNSILWSIAGPGYPGPTFLASGVTSYQHTFAQGGTYTLTCEVTADTNFVKPQRYGANRDSVSWTVEVSAQEQPPPEVSPSGSEAPLRFNEPKQIVWEDASAGGVTAYNLYRGSLSQLTAGVYGSCSQAGLVVPSAIEDPAPPPAVCWFYLVTGVNAAGEGPLGLDSAGNLRPNTSPCE